MNDKSDNSENEDAFADAFSAVVIVALPVLAIIYWLSGLPTS